MDDDFFTEAPVAPAAAAPAVETVAVEEVMEEPAPPPAAGALPMEGLDDDFVGGASDSAAALPAPAEGAVEDIGDAFIDAYIPAAVQEQVHTPEVVDPRVAWRKKNAEALKAKDAEEAAAKKTMYDKAQEHLKKVKETRTKTLGSRKDTNRTTAKVSASDAGVPQEGSSWDKVNAMVNWAAGVHQKDTSRFKSCLISLKTVKAA